MASMTLAGTAQTWLDRATTMDGLARRAVRNLLKELEVRGAVRDLRALDAVQLRDLGIGLGEIERCARHGR